MATYQLRAMSLGEILDGAIAVYRAHFGTLVSVAIICEGVPAIMGVYVTLGGGPLSQPGMWALASLLSAVGGLVAAGATVQVISEAYLGREPTLGGAVRYAVGKMLRLFIAGGAKYLLIGLAMFLLIVPGIFVACGYAVVVQVVVLEDLPSATDALGRSWHLTKKFKGKALMLGVVVFLFIYMPFVVAGAIAEFLPRLQLTVDVGAQLLWLMVYPIVACAFTLFYYDLRVRKEAFDLEHLSRQFGFATTSADG